MLETVTKHLQNRRLRRPTEDDSLSHAMGYQYNEVFDLKPTRKLAQSCLKNPAHLLEIWFLRMVSGVAHLVAQILNLPYRRIIFGGVSDWSQALARCDATQIANPRYSSARRGRNQRIAAHRAVALRQRSRGLYHGNKKHPKAAA
jgi:hypothetical protein